MSSNIKVIKIIAIILGGLIILGLIALFYGLANSYNRLEKKDNSINNYSKKGSSKMVKILERLSYE